MAATQHPLALACGSSLARGRRMTGTHDSRPLRIAFIGAGTVVNGGQSREGDALTLKAMGWSYGE